MTWQDNSVLRARLQDYDLPQRHFLTVPINSQFDAVVRMQLPSKIDINANSFDETYPMLVNVYAGPGSTKFSNTFSIGYQTYQITKKNIIFVEIDGRGTAQKGNDMMFSVNDRLGTYEMEDQISVTKFLVDTYKFIDPKRVAIWGWQVLHISLNVVATL